MYQDHPDSTNTDSVSQKYEAYHNPRPELDYANPDFYRERELPLPPVREPQPKQEHAAGYEASTEYRGYLEYTPTIQADPYLSEGTIGAPEDSSKEESSSRGQVQEAGPQTEAEPHRKRGLAGMGGSLLVTGALLLKFGTAGISILISVGVYALFYGYGWAFAIGIVVQLFIHEMGHALVMKLKGIPIGGLIFIPMLGAAVTMNQMPENARDEAEVGIAGPIAGTLAASFCLIMAYLQHGPSIWAPLAYFGFFINLFNLVPIVPFDGGRVLAAIDRRVWFLGFLALLGFFLWQWWNGSFSPWLLVFVALAASQLWLRGMGPVTPETQSYYQVSVGARIALTLLYFGLILVLVLAMSIAHSMVPLLR